MKSLEKDIKPRPCQIDLAIIASKVLVWDFHVKNMHLRLISCLLYDIFTLVFLACNLLVGIKGDYNTALSYKDWEIPNSQI